MKVAVIGSGIAGLSAAYALRRQARVTLFEAGSYFGGHANTVDLTLEGVTHGVDTGFLVLNSRTYPALLALFDELGVKTAPSDMSFSVQVPRAFGAAPLEWSGANLDSVFCQRRNLARPGFWRMLRDLSRFNKMATSMATTSGVEPSQSLGEFLRSNRFSAEFRDWYLLPMIACIWSCPTEQMLQFPVASLVRFCHNHGLLQIADRPQWYTVDGGSRNYVQRIISSLDDTRLSTPVRRIWRKPHGVRIATDAATEDFDRVVIATHPDQALQMLAEPSAREHALLSAIEYQRNLAVLHTDAGVLPRHRKAWAAWNYESGEVSDQRVCLHYLINRLQPLPWQTPVIVSLNPLRQIASECVVAQIDYEHPVFDAKALAAQADIAKLQGRAHTWFCGAWTGYGFHEDGLVSGRAAAASLLAKAAGVPAAHELEVA